MAPNDRADSFVARGPDAGNIWRSRRTSRETTALFAFANRVALNKEATAREMSCANANCRNLAKIVSSCCRSG